MKYPKDNRELLRLASTLERMLSDPQRVATIRSLIRPEQTVHFFDTLDAQMRSAQVVAMKDLHAVLRDEASQREWKVPYAAIEPPTDATSAGLDSPSPADAPANALDRSDFRCGERVIFQDRFLQMQEGTVVRLDERNATVESRDGRRWCVAFESLQHAD